jgi:hypothetical protein
MAIQTISVDLDPNPLPERGKIQILENSGDIEIWIDDVLRYTDTLTLSMDMTELGTYGLLLGGDWDDDGLVFDISSTINFINFKINDHEWTFPEGTGSTTTNSQGVITTLHSTIVEGVKCIKDNNEYMSSPSGLYLPSDNTLIDIEIDYEGLSVTGSLPHLIGQPSVFADEYFAIQIDSTNISVKFRESGEAVISLDYTGAIPVNGNIKVQANGANLELLLDDVVVASIVNNVYTEITDDLYFNTGFFFVPLPVTTNIQFNYIKINDNEWTFPEGTGSTTTNSQSVVTTLHSNVDTEAMWVINRNTDHMWIKLN